MGRAWNKLRSDFAAGRLPLGLSLGILALAWLGSMALLLGQRACQVHPLNPPIRQQVSRDGYTLLLIRPRTFLQADAQRIVELFFTVYPKAAARFNPAAPKALTLILEPAEGLLETGPTLGVVRHQNSRYLMHKPQDIDVVTFNVFRAVQAYPEKHYPAWVQEGLADYARNLYGVNNAAAGWSLGEFKKEQRYTDSYAITARFYAWLEHRFQNRILEDLDQTLRAGTYTEAFWQTHTGRTVDQLWSEYAADPRL